MWCGHVHAYMQVGGDDDDWALPDGVDPLLSGTQVRAGKARGM